MSELLKTAGRKLVDSGYEHIPSGKTNNSAWTDLKHLIFRRDGELFFVAVKDYAYKGLASFGIKQVKRAVENDAVLVLYIEQDDAFYAFDAKYIEENGEIVSGTGKQVGDQKFYNIPLEDAADLTGYVYGAERPETLAGENEELGAFM